jgi:methyl-accepting chemotaxis protein
MTSFKNLRIGVRLAIGFALLIIATLGIALFARISLGQLQGNIDELTKDRMVKLERLQKMKDSVNVIARAYRNIVLVTDPTALAAEDKRIDEARAEIARLFDLVRPTINSERGKEMLKTVEDARAPFVAQVAKTRDLVFAGKKTEAMALVFGELREAQGAYFKRMDEFIAYQNELTAKTAHAAEEMVVRAGSLMLVIALVAALAGTALAWFITVSITAPIHRAVEVAQTVAGGDLRARIEVRSNDETGQLLAALKHMNEALVETVGTVRGNANSVATASNQIAQGNADLSQRTEEQASNLQQTAASMEQLTATVKQNADTARQAAQMATSASTVAAQGGEVVGRVVATMEDISASSKKIADIIGTIDGIAFQTNILALNAAVEAARAGEQGRGFAVVASEVRSLAQRSAQAAKEIKGLIGASVEKVAAGTALVDDAGRTMGEIVSQVKRVSDLISEISAASVEQTSGIGQIGDAVSQLDQVTQQNAALVEESAAAAESLKVQAVQLAQAVAFFTLDERSAAASAAVPAAVRSPCVSVPGAVPGFKPPAAVTAGAAAPRARTPRPLAGTPANGRVGDPAEAGAEDWASF